MTFFWRGVIIIRAFGKHCMFGVRVGGSKMPLVRWLDDHQGGRYNYVLFSRYQFCLVLVYIV